MILGYFIEMVSPAARLGGFLQRARTNGEPSSWSEYRSSPAFEAYDAAADCDGLDGTAVVECIEALIPRVRAVEHVDETIALVKEFQRRDSDNDVGYSHLGTLHYQRYELGREVDDLRRAVEQRRKGVASYPTSPHRRIYLANFLEELAAATNDSEIRAATVRELQTSLELESKRVYVSQPNRMTGEQIAEVERRIERLSPLR